MARTKTTNATTTETDEAKQSNDVVFDNTVWFGDEIKVENDELKKQLEELKAQMALMAQMMAVNKPVATQPKSNRQIRFINMCNGTAVLRGTSMWKIDGQFTERVFSETEANIIVANMNNLIRSGRVYIADKDFVDEHDLTEVYKYIIDVDTLKALFDKSGDVIIETYKMANEAQKQIIVDMISDKKMKGQYVDANAAIEIGKLCGKDLINIEPMDEG